MVESPVEVLQDGRQGELIRVRPRTSSEAVLARVVGRGKLEITR
ncbi:flagella basal body P-ring formation protein FlgA [Pandoraea sputorum]